MATGNGAYILHKTLEKNIHGYQVAEYSSKLEFMPFFMPFAISLKNADLIHTVPDYGLFFYKKNIPLVITVHHYMCDGKMRPYSSFFQNIHYQTDLKWFVKNSIAKASVVTAVSKYTANHIQNELKLKQKIKVIYNGIDNNHFRPKSTVKKNPQIKILFSGNFTKRKGFQWLPSIASQLNNKISINFTSGLRSYKNKPNIQNLNALGRIKYKEMPRLYNFHDIFLAPTVREGFGLSIAEAMACGLPVVASNCSAIPELIDDKKGGFLCPVGDVNAFAEKINILAESPKLRKEMGEYNRAKVEKYFTLERMIREYRNLFEEVLN